VLYDVPKFKRRERAFANVVAKHYIEYLESIQEKEPIFWKEPTGLKNMPPSSKVGISILLVVAGIGYLFGFLNIYLTYSPADQRPGLLIRDIRIAFYGAREATKLEKAIDGAMRQYFPDGPAW
jgi:hypothetical protein